MNNLKNFREAKGWTLQRLADAVGSSKAYMWQLENKPDPQPSVRLAFGIAAALSVKVDVLFNVAAPLVKLYRKRPVVVEAYQVPPEGDECSEDMVAFLGRSDREIESQHDGSILIHTLEGVMTASPGDYIIRGVHGEFYPCKPDIFEATYEAVSAQTSDEAAA